MILLVAIFGTLFIVMAWVTADALSSVAHNLKCIARILDEWPKK